MMLLAQRMNHPLAVLLGRRRARVGAGVVLCLGFCLQGLFGLAAEELAAGCFFSALLLGAALYLLCMRAPRFSQVLEAVRPGCDGGIELAARVDALERASFAWPLAGYALMGPFLLHYVIGSLASGTLLGLSELGKWILLSLVAVGPALLTAAFCAWRFGRGLSHKTPQAQSLDVILVLLLPILASLLPGGLLVIPVLVVAATAVLLLPGFLWARALAERERQQIRASREVEGPIGLTSWRAARVNLRLSAAHRAAALRALAEHLRPPELSLELDRALEEEAPLVEAALEIARASGARLAAPRLWAVVGRSDRELARLAMELLCRSTSDPRLVPDLLAALRHPDPAIRVMAARGLGQAADLTHVAELVSARAASKSRKLRSALTDAIRRIQARQDRPRGALALVAPGESGALALSEGAGALSVAAGEERREG